jgi:hypothetical protein
MIVYNRGVTILDYLLFYVPLKNRRHHCRWRAAKFRPMLGAQGLWAGRGLYRATPAVTWDLGFSGFIRRTAPFSRLLRHEWGCGGPILTRVLTGQWCHDTEKAYCNTWQPYAIYCHEILLPKKKDQTNTGIFVALKWFLNFCEKDGHFRGYRESN